ncbi:acyltransferase [Paenibacillus sp. SYP-B3998]|uniref:Acyltransferase n=1 Tax=Paenibacillus sp. SYP-B3998 TaxID=2678564 RepID=A0A6G3ZZY9_9BACL|nr:acyltransferase [Paenibacillus sp. SYP-B3998]NEW07618.1 acyltransferase [Paenibacillus sp. SYP-B3998]
MLTRPKIPEIDIVRAIAIIAVVIIHGTANATLLPVGTGSQAFFFILNRACLFTVPVFIWISGVVLFYNYYDRWDPSTSFAFWTKRLRRILIPYLLWSVFYYVYNQYMFHGKVTLNAWYLFKLVLSGNASYHLYYMLIIVQFYILFPFVITAVRKFPLLNKALIPLGICLQAAAYSVNHWVHPLPEYSSLFTSYSALFAFGAFTGIHYAAMSTWIARYRSWILSAMVLGGFAFVGMLLLHQYGWIAVENTWFELALLLYCMTAALIFVQLGQNTLHKDSSFSKALTALGAASFGIYLAHPALLTLWDRLKPAKERILLYDLHTVTSFVIGLLGTWLLVRLYAHIMKKGKVSVK